VAAYALGGGIFNNHVYQGVLGQFTQHVVVVVVSVFSCTVLLVSISQVIGCEDRLRNDLYCVEWGVKLYSIHPSDRIMGMSLWPHFFWPTLYVC